MTYRIGRKNKLNIYEITPGDAEDRSICQCHTPEDAARIVAAVNAREGAGNRCPHPARNGKHEWYWVGHRGRTQCRACGAIGGMLLGESAGAPEPEQGAPPADTPEAIARDAWEAPVNAAQVQYETGEQGETLRDEAIAATASRIRALVVAVNRMDDGKIAEDCSDGYVRELEKTIRDWLSFLVTDESEPYDYAELVRKAGRELLSTGRTARIRALIVGELRAVADRFERSKVGDAEHAHYDEALDYAVEVAKARIRALESGGEQ